MSSIRVLLRAAPRAVLLVVLAVGALTSDLDWLRVLAAMLFVLNAGLTLSPGWRHYVRTGERLPAEVAEQYREPGDCEVELVDTGSREIEVVKALREVRGLDLLGARTLAAPGTVAAGLSADSAQAVVTRLSDAGATARVVPVGLRG